MKFLIVLLTIFYGTQSVLYYDSYTGKPLSDEDYRRAIKANSTYWCINAIEPCDPKEGRRIDGSCNNVHHPARGAPHTPFIRLLPAVYDADFEPKKPKCSPKLQPARFLRTRLLSEGRVQHQQLTDLSMNYFVFMAAEVTTQQDTVNYVLWRPYCCQEKGKADKQCTPNLVPFDDPVHRFSGIRCLNMTRPMSFQSEHCTRSDTVPERVIGTTPLPELSVIYGTSDKALRAKSRTMRGGLLKTEVENGKIWPPSTKTPVNNCLQNQKPRETRCHDTVSNGPNSLGGIIMISVWFWRLHNKIATELAKVNPCWDDEKLFTVAKDINVAISVQIMYYDLMPSIFGFDNVVKSGLLSPSFGFRDLYNPHNTPQHTLEFSYALRYFHTMQNGISKMYDKNGHYMKQVPAVNLTLRSGFYSLDNNMEGLTQGTFRQGCGSTDYTVDPDMTGLGLGGLQKSLDILTNDLAKGRYFGFQPYVKYRELCFGKPIKTFDDLRGIMSPERIEILKDLYGCVDDIDLLAGIWQEAPIPGGFGPPTLYCLVVDQLKRYMTSDRHWYERPNRPNAFSFAQLLEIRKMTIARMLCEVGDTVTQIQPLAFLRAGLRNKMKNCNQIEAMDFWAWQDPRCASNPWDYIKKN